MRRAFVRWLSGDAPAIVGAWLDQSGVCLVRMDWAADSQGMAHVVYEPCGQYAEGANTVAETNSAARANALRSAFEKLGSGSYALALGIPATDIFIKSIEIPPGLDDKQVAQLSIVEAVSNLPVPPEEICSDFLRSAMGVESHNEKVDLAFCRREVIDTLSILAEDVGISLAIVDRELQAIHDAAQWCLAKQRGIMEAQYPLGILMQEEDARFLICRSALDLTSYELNSNSLQHLNQAQCADPEELKNYCRRAGLTEGPQGYLKQLLVSRDDAAVLTGVVDGEVLAERVDVIDPRLATESGADGVSLAGLMIATGMALRQNQ